MTAAESGVKTAKIPGQESANGSAAAVGQDSAYARFWPTADVQATARFATDEGPFPTQTGLSSNVSK
jgi:hypothetical protein